MHFQLVLHLHFMVCSASVLEKKWLLNTTHVSKENVEKNSLSKKFNIFSAFPFHRLQFITNVIELQCTLALVECHKNTCLTL